MKGTIAGAVMLATLATSVPLQPAAAQDPFAGALFGGAAGAIIGGAATGRTGGAIAGGIIGAAIGASRRRLHGAGPPPGLLLVSGRLLAATR